MTIDVSVVFFQYFFAITFALALFIYLIYLLLKRFKPTSAKAMLKYRFRASIALLVSIVVMLVVLPHVLLPISAGQVGVLWKRFDGGTLIDEPFAEGTVLVMPWDKLVTYSSRFQTRSFAVEAVTNEGLKLHLEMIARYRPVRQNIPLLHKLVGEHYADVLLVPEVGSSARLLISAHTAEQVYTNKRELIQTQLFNHVNRQLKLNESQLLKSHNMTELSEFVQLEDVLIREILLPEKVNAAIINKVNQNYLEEEYTMRLKVADKEAQRKMKEAEGIAAFQAKVSGGISETYLRWRGIEATVELAKSNNAKVVVIGSGKDGLPLILNTDSSLSGSPASLPQATDTQGQTSNGATMKDTSVEIGSSSYDPK